MKCYTVKEIADIASVSKTTIQRTIKENKIEADREKSQTRYYSYEKMVFIIEQINPFFDFSNIRNEQQQTETETEAETETEQTEPQETEPRAEEKQSKPQETAKTETDKEYIDYLRQEIAELKEIVKSKDSQIIELSNRLMTITETAQTIASQAQIIQAMNSKNILPETTETAKQSIFSRIFRKNKRDNE